MGESTSLLSGVFTSANLSGVLDELLAVVPVVIPVAIGYMAVRKAISFVLGIIHNA